MRLRSYGSLILVLLVAVGTCYYYFDLLLPSARVHEMANGMAGGYSYGGDFYPIWLTGRELLLHGRNPYTREMTRAIQTGLFGRAMDPRRPADPPVDFRAFSYPLYADLIAAPLLPLGFDAVRFVLALLLPLLTAASLVLWLRALQVQPSSSMLTFAMILLLVSYPVLEGLYLQQTGLLVGAALAMAMAAITRGRLLLAGMLMALASVKPQLMWLLALWLLSWVASDWKHRKRFALGFIFTIALLFLVSQLVLPGWLAGWWRSMVDYSRYTLPPLTQLVLGRLLGAVVGMVFLTLACAIGWRMRGQPAGSTKFTLVMSFILAVTVILAPTGGAVFDDVILLPGILWLWFRRSDILNASRPMRVLVLTGVVALCWQWFAACAVALASLFSPVFSRNSAILVLPTRMAAPLPFVILALLSFFVVKALRERAGARTDSMLTQE